MRSTTKKSTRVSKQSDAGPLLKVVEAFRAIDPEMPMQQAAVFLMVARQPEITMSELADRLGLTQPSASRNVAALTHMHRLRKPGLNLLETHEDPNDRRFKVISLTPRGKSLFNILTK